MGHFGLWYDEILFRNWCSKVFDDFLGGDRPNQLQKVQLTIVKNSTCSSKQFCTYTPGHDTCQVAYIVKIKNFKRSYQLLFQYDSGGPLFYQDPEDIVLFNVGIISYGIACATNNPSVNIKVSEYLDFIMQNTRQTIYCVK